MALPTATEITNAYLYKNKLTPKAEERVDSIQILEKGDEHFEVNFNWSKYSIDWRKNSGINGRYGSFCGN